MERIEMLQIAESGQSHAIQGKSSRNAADVMLQAIRINCGGLRSEPETKLVIPRYPDLKINNDTYTFYHSGSF